MDTQEQTPERESELGYAKVHTKSAGPNNTMNVVEIRLTMMLPKRINADYLLDAKKILDNASADVYGRDITKEETQWWGALNKLGIDHLVPYVILLQNAGYYGKHNHNDVTFEEAVSKVLHALMDESDEEDIQAHIKEWAEYDEKMGGEQFE